METKTDHEHLNFLANDAYLGCLAPCVVESITVALRLARSAEDHRRRGDAFERELSLLRTQARKDNDRAETADTYERWLLEIGRVVGCGHLDEQLPNCVIRALQGDDETRWYDPAEVSREIWDGDLWWYDNGEQVFPVNIAWCPTGEFFFATLGQWGWNVAQKLTDLGGQWTPCVAPPAKRPEAM